MERDREGTKRVGRKGSGRERMIDANGKMSGGKRTGREKGWIREGGNMMVGKG